jgi:hypothetical protein
VPDQQKLDKLKAKIRRAVPTGGRKTRSSASRGKRIISKNFGENIEEAVLD